MVKEKRLVREFDEAFFGFKGDLQAVNANKKISYRCDEKRNGGF